MKTLSNNLTGLYINLMNKFVAAKNDVSGSETTEKIGMVVVAVVIVGLLIAAMNQFMPQLFQSIIDLAKTKFEEMVLHSSEEELIITFTLPIRRLSSSSTMNWHLP